MNRRHTLRSTCLAAASCLAMASAHAEPPAALDRISVWLGGYGSDYEATVGVQDLPGGVSVTDQRVLDGNKVVNRARIDWLLMDRQGFSVDYFSIRNSGQRSAQGPITANGITYDVNAQARYDTKLDVGNFSYRWWLGEDNNLFGIGVGAQYYSIKAKLWARASNSLLGTFDDVAETSETGWAPLLTLGWRTQLNDQWRLYADASGSRYTGGDARGSIVNAAVGVEYFPWKHVGLGAEYGTARIRYKHVDDNYTARLNVKMDGPAVFLRLRF